MDQRKEAGASDCLACEWHTVSTVGWVNLMDGAWDHKGCYHLWRGVRNDGVVMAGGPEGGADAPDLTRDIPTGDWREEGT